MQSLFLEIPHEVRFTNPLEFLFWPLVLVMLILGLVRFRSPKIIFYLFKIAGNNAHLHLYLREGFNLKGISSYLLQFNYFLVLGCLGYGLYDFYAKPLETDTFVLIFVFIGPFFYFLIKFGLVHLLIFLTDTAQGFFEYLTNHRVFFQIQGLALLPIAVFLIFTSGTAKEYWVYIAISVIVLISLFKLALSILYAIRYGFSFIYIFLYLCTLEILPLVVIFKILNDKMLELS